MTQTPRSRAYYLNFAQLLRGLTLLLAVAILPSTIYAEDNQKDNKESKQQDSQEDVEERLKALDAEISKYKEMLESTQGQKSEVEATLQRNEIGISELIKSIDDIERELKKNQNKVSTLSREQKELLVAKGEQQYYIEQQIRSAYEIGHQEYLKVLLNQEDPETLSRMLTYYDYFNRARAEQISEYNATIEQLEQVTQALGKQMLALEANQSSLTLDQQQLALAQREKRNALKGLVVEIRSTGSELTRLAKDRGQLEQLLEKLQESLANLSTPGSDQPFSGMRGKMQLPIMGNISHRFGHHRNEGKLRWQGVFIDASEGDPVHAVHYGRVVFSDWLRGFGLLMIISHGEGYMSLYGHNQVLYRGTGDWVTAGDVIAAVGDSGGQNKTGLYFEIRIGGKPSDPQKWCVAREQRAA
ncbi:MAG: septal ring factor EnvC (AmiA/AmiB activator) [Candidatus Azotimanducaceae bacterium]|jgi:septal ring factor EnvC (AmiA/AmiB activator)